MQHLPLNEGLVFSPSKSASLIALDEALTRLESFDARKAQVVELRYFSGMSVEETAEALKVSLRSVQRDWKLARLWLYRELTHVCDEDSPTVAAGLRHAGKGSHQSLIAGW